MSDELVVKVEAHMPTKPYVQPFSKAQILVLLLIDTDGPREATKITHHGYISGACARALSRRGLVIWNGVDKTYSLTTAGRTVVEVIKAMR